MLKKVLKIENQFRLLSSVCLLFLFTSVYSQTPTITSVTPNGSVTFRSQVTITGTNFVSGGITAVRFGSSATNVTPLSITETEIIVAVPSITMVPTNAASMSIAVNIRRTASPATNYSAGTLTYIAAAPTVTGTSKVSRVITDYQGYWSSTAATSTPSQQPDRQHSVSGIEYGGVIYSTGVADAVLASKGINYTAGDFKALPVNNILGTTPASATASNFFAMASRMDGSATSGVPGAPEVVARKAKDVLIDGVKGLGLGTGMTNMSSSSVFEFIVTDIAASRINDAEPDVVVSQIASPTTNDTDIYCFVDANGNIVGKPVTVTMATIPAIGTYKLDLFNITFNSTYDVATLSTTSSVNTTRDIRLVGYKLSDFGITTANMDNVAKFKIMPSGISDPAFIAYNANSMLIPAPKIVTNPASVVACTGSGTSTSFTVTATGPNLSYQWKKNGVALTDTGNITGATTATVSVSNVSASDVATYICEVTNAAGTVVSNPAYLNTIISVQPAAVTTACKDVDGPIVDVIANGLSLSYQWYRNTTTSTTTGTAIPGATSYYYQPPVNVVGTTYYYVIIENSGQGCARQTSSSARFNVAAASTPGDAYVGTAGTTTASVCTGGTASLGVVGSTGPSSLSYQWEYSADGSTGWNTYFASNGTTVLGNSQSYTTPALTATTYFRVRVTSTSCVVYSNIITVTVGAEAGTISANKAICSGTTTTVSVAGATGSIQWQQSADGESAWANVTGGNGATTATYTTPALTTTVFYRVVVVGASCTSPTSGTVQITVNPGAVPGTISANQAVCINNTATVAVTGASGTVQWQQSADGVTGWANVTGGTVGTDDSYITPALTATTYYRAVISSVGCGSATTGVTTVTVTPFNVGVVSNNQTICSGATATVTITGSVGNIQWQQSVDGLTGWANVTGGSGATTASYTTPALATTTYYRALVSNPSCSVPSGSTTVNVTAVTAGTVSSNQAICANTTAIVTLTGSAGNIQWQQSADGVTGWANVTGGSGAATASYTTPALTATTYYRAQLTGGACTATSGVTTVTVTAGPAAGTASGGATICPNTTTGLTLSGSTGTIQWQQSADGVTAWASVTGGSGATTANYTTAALTTTTYFRALLTMGSCTSTSNVVTITVNNTFIWNGSISSDWHVAGNWSCNAIPTLGDNCVIPLTSHQPIVSQDIMAYAKSLNIQAGAILTINTLRNITVQDNIAVNATGNMIVNNRANLVQNPLGTSNTNTGNITVKRNSSPLFRNDYTLWSTPVDGQKLFQFSPLTIANRFYTYNSLQDLYVSVPGLSASSITTFNTGVAYLIRMPNSNATAGYNGGTTAITLNQQFTGKPNNGTINVPVSLDSDNYNGVGNPYPSTINIFNFIDGNEDNLYEGTLWFWRKKNNNDNTSYTAINKTGYAENQAEGGNVGSGFIEGDEANWVINPGQGFIIRAADNATHVTFTNSMRRAVNNNQFFRNASAPVLSRLWINMTSATGAYSQTLLGYSDATTDGMDFGYDSSLFTDGPSAVYTKAGSQNLLIQAKGSFHVNDIVPLHYRATDAGSYTIALHKHDGLFAQGQNVYLKDTQTGTIHDIKAGPYSFTTPAGVIEGRFEVLYVNSALGTDNPELTANSLVVYKEGSSIRINAGTVAIAGVKVFDTRGRLVHEAKHINATSAVITNLTAEEQVLIVQVTTVNGATISRKVVY